jgi:hypothetical protein
MCRCEVTRLLEYCRTCEHILADTVYDIRRCLEARQLQRLCPGYRLRKDGHVVEDICPQCLQNADHFQFDHQPIGHGHRPWHPTGQAQTNIRPSGPAGHFPRRMRSTQLEQRNWILGGDPADPVEEIRTSPNLPPVQDLGDDLDAIILQQVLQLSILDIAPLQDSDTVDGQLRRHHQEELGEYQTIGRPGESQSPVGTASRIQRPRAASLPWWFPNGGRDNTAEWTSSRGWYTIQRCRRSHL